MSSEKTQKAKAARRRPVKRSQRKSAKKEKPQKAPTLKSLLKKAYRVVDKKLDDAKLSSDGIDAVAKLVRATKDLGGENKTPKESTEIKQVNVRWEPNWEASSTEE